MSESVQDVIADQIDGLVIGSGWDVAPTRKQAEAVAGRVSAALEGSGYVVVKLPDPYYMEAKSDDESGFHEWPGVDVLVFDDGEIHFNGVITEGGEAYDLAVALLAAARHAEAVDHD